HRAAGGAGAAPHAPGLRAVGDLHVEDLQPVAGSHPVASVAVRHLRHVDGHHRVPAAHLDHRVRGDRPGLIGAPPSGPARAGASAPRGPREPATARAARQRTVPTAAPARTSCGEWSPASTRALPASTARNTAGHASRGAAAASPTASANAITVWLLGKDQLSGGGHADTMSWRWQGRTSANRSFSSRFSPYARAAASPP